MNFAEAGFRQTFDAEPFRSSERNGRVVQEQLGLQVEVRSLIVAVSQAKPDLEFAVIDDPAELPDPDAPSPDCLVGSSGQSRRVYELGGAAGRSRVIERQVPAGSAR